MGNEITTLLPDEAWVMERYRIAKKSGYADLVIRIHDGQAESITATEKFKRRAGDAVQLRD